MKYRLSETQARPLSAFRLLGRRWDRAIATALVLGGLATPSSAQSAGVVIGPAGVSVPGAAEGERLLGELNCAACHRAAAAVQTRLASRSSPHLGEAGLRLTPQYLRAFISHPQTEKPGTTMPDLLHALPPAERAEAVDALVHFLVSLQPTNSPVAVGADYGRIEQGRLLYHQVGCVACHAPQVPASALNARNDALAATLAETAAALAALEAASVPLGNLAKKTTVEEMTRFLLDPLKVRPSGRMPSLNLNNEEAAAVAMYLLRDQADQAPERSPQRVRGLTYAYYEGDFDSTVALDRQKPKATGLVEKFTLKPRRRDDNIGFRFSGFLNIPATGTYTFYTASDDGTRLFVGGKPVVDNEGTHATTERKGSVALTAGDQPISLVYFNGGGELTLRVSFEGPGFSKREISAASLSTQDARTMAPLDEEKLVVNPDQADRGRQLFGSLGCAACHQTGRGVSAPAVAAKALRELKSAGGCLAETVAAGLPRYALTSPQRESLRTALRDPEALARPLDSGEQVARTLAALNCLACHARGGAGGPGPGRAEYFGVVGEADLGDEGRLPPHLNGVGNKLRPEWLKQVLVSHGTARPYMATRMPQFGEANVGPLVAALTQAEATSVAAEAGEASNRDVGIGRKLVGTGGLGCISCHTFGGRKSLGIPAMDLTLMPQRLRKEWFHRYLLEPAALRPGTRMPSFWPEGRSARADILNGDPDRQIDAVWAYLGKAKEAGLPPGLIQGRIELVATNEAILYRNFIEGAGSRAIGVGYPEKANLAFDANNLRLALIWQGPFIDAGRHRTGRGDGFEPPLGYNVVKLPTGPPLAVLASADTPWPTESGRKGGFQMRGYRLDEKRRPTFLYSFQNLQVEDFPVAAEGELEAFFRRTLTFRADAPPSKLFFRAWAGPALEAKDDGSFVAGDRVKFRFALADGARAVVRQSAGQFELLVPVMFHGPEAKIVEEIIW